MMKNWYWCKIHTPYISIDYSVVMDFEANILQTGALVTDRENLIISPAESLTDPINDTMTEESMGYTFSKCLTLKGSKGELTYIANIVLEELVMIEKGQL